MLADDGHANESLTYLKEVVSLFNAVVESGGIGVARLASNQV